MYTVVTFGGRFTLIVLINFLNDGFPRASAKEIYATMHLVCDQDIPLSTCTNEYGRTIQRILKNYCIRYFTLQFEFITQNESDQVSIYRCAHVLNRRRRGHTLDEPIIKLAKDAIDHIH